jgi:hypothetical protein
VQGTGGAAPEVLDACGDLLEEPQQPVRCVHSAADGRNLMEYSWLSGSCVA